MYLDYNPCVACGIFKNKTYSLHFDLIPFHLPDNDREIFCSPCTCRSHCSSVMYVNACVVVASGTGATYYTVAVVKKSNPSINIFNLAGRNSCHTGKGRTAGWKMPLGYFLDQGYISMLGCNVAQGRKHIHI